MCYRKVARKAQWQMIILVSDVCVVAGNWGILVEFDENGVECSLGRGLL